MNTAFALDLAQLSSNAAVAEQIDNLFPVESPAKPNGVFASDCCGSNNYPS